MSTARTRIANRLNMKPEYRTQGALEKRVFFWGTELLVFDNGIRPTPTFTLILPSWEPRNFNPDGSLPLLFARICADEGIDDSYYGAGTCPRTERNAYPQFGKRIRWFDLPRSVQRVANRAFPTYTQPVLGLYTQIEADRAGE